MLMYYDIYRQVVRMRGRFGEGKSDMRKEYLFDNYQQLASAVVKNAADDYRRARNRKKRYEEKKKKDVDDSISLTNREIQMIEKFFRQSEWFDFLPNLDGEYILLKLKEEFE